ncbi:hypothetical protein [Skermania piniformis]|uniref:Transcriptional regulator, AbiEi antitoxin, Type IV TA system n=1 Tax=Skermania pinensis TaxID=39122 RepID=A0ABX8S9E1_9ACTN|nr:hypothetical protein [Skermania piniformis]QXQ14485.1 hypothetical protein KV203_03500 [Skermania piniformis]
MTAEPLHRRTALAAGYTDAELRRCYRSPGWTRLRAGSYLPPGDIDAERRHRLLAAATLPGLAAGSVLSHQSALIWHGLPTWNVPLDRVHVTRDQAAGGRRTRLLHVHCAPLPAAAVIAGADPAVCTPARAVADLARTVDFEQAVVTGDATLRARLCDSPDLRTAAAYATNRPGHRAALRVFEFLDPRSESVGESRSRVLLHRLDVPPPQLQSEIRDEHGRLVGRVDFCWAGSGVVGEFDGRVKYGRLSRPGQTAGDVVFQEKVREDRLRDLGWVVVRWTWADLDRPEAVRERLHRAFARPHPTRGTVLRAELPAARGVTRAGDEKPRGGLRQTSKRA